MIRLAKNIDNRWTVPIRDWNSSGRSQKISGSFSIMLNCTYERLKHKCANITEFVISNPKKNVEPYLWEIETQSCRPIKCRSACWTVPMSDWDLMILLHTGSCNCWTVPTSEQCALYTVINVDEKERKPEQLMSVRQIWIVRVFYFRCCVYALCINCKNLPLRE